MTVARRRRGEPLFILGVVILAWIGVRGAMWESPFALPEALAPVGELFAEAPVESIPESAELASLEQPEDRLAATARRAFTRLVPALPRAVEFGSLALLATRGEPVDSVAGHHLMWLAAMRHDDESIASGQPGAASRLLPSRSGEQPAVLRSRWSLDGWLFLREGGRGATTGVFAPSYGASQAGAVLRYRLAPTSRHRPTAYLRATAALAGMPEQEAALGLSARLLPGVPLAAQVEARLRQAGGDTEVRPAALVVSEFPPLDLPGGLQAEAYAQAGYVGGDFATGFADGQARVTREVARFDLASVRAGAGAWAGAQRGAARVDIGPSATIDLRLGEAPARLAVDYRLRVAGDAEPGSGVAVTLSTGF